ncbi:hypothetical protein OPT61_g10491 [Boeremia exigua]|uniref:Uncharacterized protein n=1 Tax=Boeremia exigua TaxID=749465 RepID=A0ACC2HQ51_9PLEO|nr:hypothetical protein OPT61_g10491 [Boeremia exigua]
MQPQQRRACQLVEDTGGGRWASQLEQAVFLRGGYVLHCAALAESRRGAAGQASSIVPAAVGPSSASSLVRARRAR